MKHSNYQSADYLVDDGAIFVRMVDNCTKYVADLAKRWTGLTSGSCCEVCQNMTKNYSKGMIFWLKW